MTEFKLSEKQQSTLDLMLAGESIFLTGPAGVGKSAIIKAFMEQSENKHIAITSTTGISAVHIGGSTLHSYLGIGIGEDDAEKLISKIKSKWYSQNRWKKLQTLIIDEVSMLTGELFDKLEYIAQEIRMNDEEAFGGVQLILCGDFLQLPPVDKSDNKVPDYCFSAECWNSCIKHTIHLTEIFRQNNDVAFQKALNQIRFADFDSDTRELLDSRIGAELKNEMGIKPTKLYTTNAKVNRVNTKELMKLRDGRKFKKYKMKTEPIGNAPNFVVDRCKKNCIVVPELLLCIDAQVMLLTNLDLENGLANGSRGVVTKFSEHGFPTVAFLNGMEVEIEPHVWDINENEQPVVSIRQIPLKVAYAITIHKSQGSTIDYAEIDLSKSFEYGQSYTALSRVKSIEGLSIIGIDYLKIKAHPLALDFYNNL